jgi:hypothetical protein
MAQLFLVVKAGVVPSCDSLLPYGAKMGCYGDFQEIEKILAA